MKTILFAISFLAISLFTGCSPKIVQKQEISQAKIQKASWDDLEGFEQDNLQVALEVFRKDCVASQKNQNLKDVCIKVNDSNLTKDPKEFFVSNFTPYKLIGEDKKETGLITGYYEPSLRGSLYQTAKYKYPVYETPTDLITIKLDSAYPDLKKYRLRGKLVKNNTIIPYMSREQIESRHNRYNRALKPICFVEDKIDLFFLHIQGSGKINLPNGKIIYVGYAQQNGRKYYSIGRKLIEDGYLTKEEVSLQSIKKWLKQNPAKVDEILNLNESYVFFRRNTQGATGSLGIELVPNRNLAVDTSYIPLGFPVFLSTTNPISKKPINQLMIAADTGGAIKGEIRADYFFGSNLDAEELAGKMKQEGTLYMLVPKSIDKKED